MGVIPWPLQAAPTNIANLKLLTKLPFGLKH